MTGDLSAKYSVFIETKKVLDPPITRLGTKHKIQVNFSKTIL